MADGNIEHRNVELEFSSHIPKHWHSGNARISRMFDALSMSFPPGEKSFIDSVRSFADQIEDPELRKDIAGFIRQEANHTREHTRYNNTLKAQGIDVDFHTSLTGKPVELTRRYLSPKRNLARTVGMEHITAVLGDLALGDPRIMEGADPEVRQIWQWHAMEEIEHKGVAYDVFLKAVPNPLERYFLRSTVMLWSTLGYLVGMSTSMTMLLWQDGKLFDIRDWWQAFKFFWVRPAMLPKAVIRWLAYFRPGFHPWDHDNSKLLKEQLEKLSKARNETQDTAINAAP